MKKITEETLAAGAGDTAPPVDYYDSNASKFLVLNTAGRWLALSLADYKRHLRSRGLNVRPDAGELLSEADEVILEVQNHRDVAFHGPICGRNAGPLIENGSRVLVTEDMKLPDSALGNWSTLRAVFEGLFLLSEDPHIGETQLYTVYGWIKSTVEALRAGKQQQQQVLAMCGAAGCGKSLIQHLLTDMLAGRSAKAERYFSGKTPFNADLFAAEHLILEDEHCSTRIIDRLRLGASFKQHCVGVTTASLHTKHKTAVNLPAWWRVSITLNDDPEAMMVLPPLDEHVADKIILLRARHFKFPMPVTTNAERSAFREQLAQEIPAFLYFLLHEWEIPQHCADPRRYNVATFHHPSLAEALESLSPEAELLNLLDRTFADELESGQCIEMTARKIEDHLRAHDWRRADKLFKHLPACGTYLGRLSRKRPDRVQPKRTNKARLWIISPEE
tara:strand:- start:10992 stop:12332 length:1341 start_codon:yes stop_codon:yes gene_type:complete